MSLVLEYGGPAPQPLFILGRDAGVEAILRDEASFRKVLPSFPVTKAAQRSRVRLTELSKQ